MTKCTNFIKKIVHFICFKLFLMKPISFYICFLVYIFSACTAPKTNDMAFVKHKKLVAEKIPVNEIFAPDFVTKSGDHFVISSSASDTTLFIYETPSLKFKKAMGVRGNGPDEIQTFPMFGHTVDKEYLYIRGYSPLSIRKTSIQPNGSLNFIDEYFLDQYDEYNYMNVIKDSIFIYYNSTNLAITKYDLKNKIELGKIEFKKEDHQESFYYSNRGYISANDSFIIYPYVYKKQIDIYSIDKLKRVKSIKDGKKYPTVSINDRGNITWQYFNIYASKKYFYALYVGHKENENFFDRTLEVYDYAGNPIIQYSFDIVPFYFAVDEENGYIYATNSNYEDYLLRYKL